MYICMYLVFDLHQYHRSLQVFHQTFSLFKGNKQTHEHGAEKTNVRSV